MVNRCNKVNQIYANLMNVTYFFSISVTLPVSANYRHSSVKMIDNFFQSLKRNIIIQENNRLDTYGKTLLWLALNCNKKMMKLSDFINKYFFSLWYRFFILFIYFFFANLFYSNKYSYSLEVIRLVFICFSGS